MAEYMVFPADALVHQVSDQLPAAHAAFIEPLSCALHAVERASIGFDDVVVVAGCGPIGLGMVAGAAAKSPAQVVALDLDDAKLALAARCGATLTLNIADRRRGRGGPRPDRRLRRRRLPRGQRPPVGRRARACSCCASSAPSWSTASSAPTSPWTGRSSATTRSWTSSAPTSARTAGRRRSGCSSPAGCRWTEIVTHQLPLRDFQQGLDLVADGSAVDQGLPAARQPAEWAPWPRPSDRIRAVFVVVFAVAQVLAAPVTSLTMGPAADQGPISDANLSPVTPAGYAFAIWALIYAGSLVLAVYQLLPSQLSRTVHRRTGWWLVGAFAASTVWVPIFGTRIIWLSQLVIIMLVVCLVFATLRFTRLGTSGERGRTVRLPDADHDLSGLGDAGLLCRVRHHLPVLRHAGGRALGERDQLGAGAERDHHVAVRRGPAGRGAGFLLSGCWALVAVAVATYVDSVRLAAVLAITVVVAVVIGRTLRSPDRDFVLFG